MADCVYFNPNPFGNMTGDCVIRAICAVTGQDWDTTYTGVTLQGFVLKQMPSTNSVWDAYLRSKGFVREGIPDTCPDNCYTVNDFADDHKRGAYVLGTGDHAVAVIDGIVMDSYDSRQKTPLYFYEKKPDKKEETK